MFDVSSKPQFYGAGAGYHCLVGRDSSRSLARMDLKDEKTHLHDLDKAQVTQRYAMLRSAIILLPAGLVVAAGECACDVLNVRHHQLE